MREGRNLFAQSATSRHPTPKNPVGQQKGTTEPGCATATTTAPPQYKMTRAIESLAVSPFGENKRLDGLPFSTAESRSTAATCRRRERNPAVSRSLYARRGEEPVPPNKKPRFPIARQKRESGEAKAPDQAYERPQLPRALAAVARSVRGVGGSMLPIMNQGLGALPTNVGFK